MRAMAVTQKFWIADHASSTACRTLTCKQDSFSGPNGITKQDRLRQLLFILVCVVWQRLATEQAGPIWEKLPDDDKAEYITMATGAPFSASCSTPVSTCVALP